jgi:predicted amidophosphoribosyltransferase
MATVDELAALVQGSMQNPAERGPGICPICRGLPSPGYVTDVGCGSNPEHLDAVVPISYAPGLGQLHTALRGYKDNRLPAVRRQQHVRLAAVLWKFLLNHEECVADAAGARAFDLVAVVPSKTPEQDERRDGLRALVGETCGHTSGRYRRVLRATGQGAAVRYFDPRRYAATETLDGRHVLLIDDMWTSGASGQSAAHTLKEGGARTVSLVAIGRFIRRDYADHGARLDALPQVFDWATCAVHR